MPEAEPAGAPASLTLLHVTDPHLFAAADGAIHGVRTAESFGAVLRQALARAPARVDAILVTGDVAEDLSAGAYQRCRAALLASGIPAFCLPGNHDEPDAMARLLTGDGLQYAGTVSLGGWRLVLLDSHLSGATHGLLGARRLAALEAQLQAAGSQPVLVAVHHPAMPVGSAWMDELALQDGAALLEVLHRYPRVRALLCGHVHQAFDESRDGLRLLATPSTCVQFKPRSADFALDTRPPGWRWLQLRADGQVDTRVEWLEG